MLNFHCSKFQYRIYSEAPTKDNFLKVLFDSVFGGCSENSHENNWLSPLLMKLKALEVFGGVLFPIIVKHL